MNISIHSIVTQYGGSQSIVFETSPARDEKLIKEDFRS